MSKQVDKKIMVNKLTRMIEQTDDNPFFSHEAKEARKGLLRGLITEVKAGKYDYTEDEE